MRKIKLNIASIQKKAKTIEINAKKIMDSMFTGSYKSVFKGKGLEFHEVREYEYGDDVRTIDWKVTARMNKPFIKKFIEERELNLVLLIDISGSTFFGSRIRTKKDLAAELSAVLTLAALRNNDKVSLLLFSNIVENFLPPNKGREHMMRIIRDILYFKPINTNSNPSSAIKYLLKILKRKSIILFISDFIGEEFLNKDFLTHLNILNQKHDTVILRIYDKIEKQFPETGWYYLTDKEKLNTFFHLSKKDIDNMLKQYQIYFYSFKEWCLSSGIDFIEIATEDDYILLLKRFFKERSKKRSA